MHCGQSVQLHRAVLSKPAVDTKISVLIQENIWGQQNDPALYMGRDRMSGDPGKCPVFFLISTASCMDQDRHHIGAVSVQFLPSPGFLRIPTLLASDDVPLHILHSGCTASAFPSGTPQSPGSGRAAGHFSEDISTVPDSMPGYPQWTAILPSRKENPPAHNRDQTAPGSSRSSPSSLHRNSERCQDTAPENPGFFRFPDKLPEARRSSSALENNPYVPDPVKPLPVPRSPRRNQRYLPLTSNSSTSSSPRISFARHDLIRFFFSFRDSSRDFRTSSTGALPFSQTRKRLSLPVDCHSPIHRFFPRIPSSVDARSFSLPGCPELWRKTTPVPFLSASGFRLQHQVPVRFLSDNPSVY